MTMTQKKIDALVQGLDDRTLSKLIAAANAEDRRRFDERCAAHLANARKQNAP